MFKNGFVALVAVTLLVGCASVPMESKQLSDRAKKFDPPAPGKAGLYIYRTGGVGGALKKDILVDGKCVGESAPKIFFYEEVTGNQEHTVSTESEFSDNNVVFTPAADKNYFIRQYIKMGVFVGGANLELVSEGEGKGQIGNLEMATKGTCSR